MCAYSLCVVYRKMFDIYFITNSQILTLDAKFKKNSVRNCFCKQALNLNKANKNWLEWDMAWTSMWNWFYLLTTSWQHKKLTSIVEFYKRWIPIWSANVSAFIIRWVSFVFFLNVICKYNAFSFREPINIRVIYLKRCELDHKRWWQNGYIFQYSPFFRRWELHFFSDWYGIFCVTQRGL